MIETLVANKEIFALVVTFLGIVLPLAQYLHAKTKEQRQKNFDNFHNKVIKIIACKKDDNDDDIKMDQQVAAVFELRNFPSYFALSRNMLIYRREQVVKGLVSKPHLQPLIDEIDRTRNYMNKNILSRLYSRITDRVYSSRS